MHCNMKDEVETTRQQQCGGGHTGRNGGAAVSSIEGLVCSPNTTTVSCDHEHPKRPDT